MTSPDVSRNRARTIDFSGTKAALWLSLTAFFALLVLYFIGMDQGATSVFGSNTDIHEFVHDARHLLGFPLPLTAGKKLNMEKQIIWRGLLAGAAAGVLAFLFARIFVEPQIDLATGYEDGIGSAHQALEEAAGVAAHSHGEDGGGFTRAVQMNIGMGLGVLLFSLAIAALFAVVFAVTYGRVGDVSARLLSLYVAGGMLLSLYVVPSLKYPASPPALSLDETIQQRTLLYLAMTVLSAALLIGAVVLGRHWAPRFGAWNATLAAAATYVVAVAVVMLILPTIDETPGPLVDAAGAILYEGFPADVLYEFRLYSLGTQVIIYTTIGLVFAAMASKLLEANRREVALPRVSEVVRLTLVSHAMTDAMAAGRFPTDEPLNAVGMRQADAAVDLGMVDSALCGPEKRTRQTAELLGLQPRVDQHLADLDCGRWRGDVLGGVEPAELALWLTDASAAPHGGETIVNLVGRVRGWLQTVTATRGRLVAVTHPAVVRAAVLVVLDAPPKSFWRIDIAPVSRTVLHFRGHTWTLRMS